MKKALLSLALFFLAHSAHAFDTLKVYINAYNCKYCNIINTHIINKYGNTDLEIILLTNAKNKKEFEYYTKLKYPNIMFSQGDSLPNFQLIKNDFAVTFQTIANLEHFLNFSWQNVDVFFPPNVTGYSSNDTLSLLAQNGQREHFHQTTYLGATTIVDGYPQLQNAFDSLKNFHNIHALEHIFEMFQLDWLDIQNIAYDGNSMIIRVNSIDEKGEQFTVLAKVYFINNLKGKPSLSQLLAFDYNGMKRAPMVATRFFATDSLLYTSLSRQPIKTAMAPEDFPKGYVSFGVFDVSLEVSSPVGFDSTYSYLPEDFNERGDLKYGSEVIAGDGDYYYRFYSSSKHVLFQPEQNIFFPLENNCFPSLIRNGKVVTTQKLENGALKLQVLGLKTGTLWDEITIVPKGEGVALIPVYHNNSTQVSALLYQNTAEGVAISSLFELVPGNEK
ncbi:MAG: hypothetical protein LAT76_10920 [Schleiferiaceae bacterium]|nr:hypothetical protein [Schleiferiaceae bacterium]